MAIKLATGPVTWGVDFAETPTNPPWQQVLDDITASGLPAMELGPVGYLPEDSDIVRKLLTERNLESAGSFICDDIHASHDRALQCEAEKITGVFEAGGVKIAVLKSPQGHEIELIQIG